MADTSAAADDAAAFASDQIVVAVRVRPLNEREMAATASAKNKVRVAPRPGRPARRACPGRRAGGRGPS